MILTAIHISGDMYRIRRVCDHQWWTQHHHHITLPLIKNNREPDNKVGELVTWIKTYVHQYHHVDATRIQNKREPDNKFGELASEQVPSRSPIPAHRNREPDNKVGELEHDELNQRTGYLSDTREPDKPKTRCGCPAPCRVWPGTLVSLASARQFAGYRLLLRFKNRTIGQMLHDALDDQVTDEHDDSGVPVDEREPDNKVGELVHLLFKRLKK